MARRAAPGGIKGSLKTVLHFALLLSLALPLCAQDPVRIDPAHNKVDYEDAKVRVIHFFLKPGEKAVMHEHPEMIVVNVTAAHVRMTSAGGEAQDVEFYAGQVLHKAPLRHALENIGTTVWEAVLTELKSSAEANLSATPGSLVPAETTPRPTPIQPQASLPKTSEPAKPAAPAPIAPAPQSSVPEPTSLNPDGAKVFLLNGTELAYIERGQGPPLVLVHDTLGDYRSWTRQLALFAHSYCVIAYSRRYHYPNHATGKERDYTYDQNAKDLADFIHALNLGPVRLIGHGYGASIAAMVAAAHPEMVQSLVISEPGFEGLLDTSGAFRSRFAREEIYGIIRKPLLKENPEKGVQIYEDWAGQQAWSAMSTEEQYRAKQNAYALRSQTLDASPPAFTCADAKKITSPTLIVSGQRRSPNSAEIAGVLSACIPNALRTTVPNAGAAAYIDDPDAYSKAVLEFEAKH